MPLVVLNLPKPKKWPAKCEYSWKLLKCTVVLASACWEVGKCMASSTKHPKTSTSCKELRFRDELQLYPFNCLFDDSPRSEYRVCKLEDIAPAQYCEKKTIYRKRWATVHSHAIVFFLLSLCWFLSFLLKGQLSENFSSLLLMTKTVCEFDSLTYFQLYCLNLLRCILINETLAVLNIFERNDKSKKINIHPERQKQALPTNKAICDWLWSFLFQIGIRAKDTQVKYIYIFKLTVACDSAFV